MTLQKPSIPKGTRDFLPSEMVKRTYIFDSIRKVFKKYGYLPIETPAMENLDTLLGKYGDEGDKLLFKILNSGDFLKNLNKDKLRDSNKVTSRIAEKGLRYDLTVPFARFVVQNRNDITLPFKRYQMQTVWRADKPQRGRYREFFQCDADVIGSDSLLNEVELIQIIDEVFTALGINVTIKLNNRKILAGIVERLGEEENFNKITGIIDKLDKIGIDNIDKELQSIGLNESKTKELKGFVSANILEKESDSKIKYLHEWLTGSQTGKKGIEEMRELLNFLEFIDIKNTVEIDLALARGLNYYTGTITEVKADNVKIGSICGGGRYDDLTGIFGLPGISGVGISFGADRIYDVMEQLKQFPENVVYSTQLLFVNFGIKEAGYCLKLVQKLREKGIPAEVYPDTAKMKKQMSYANSRGIPYVALAGENEMKVGKVTLKNMNTGDQSLISFEELLEIIAHENPDRN